MLTQTKWFAGDEIRWRVAENTAYPSTAWSLIVHIVGPVTASFSGSAIGSASGWNVTASAATTVNFTTTGSYTVFETIESGASRVTLYSTAISVYKNPETAGVGFDARSYVRRIRDSIRAVMEGRATKAEESISIAGRSLSRTSLADLVKMLKMYDQMVAEEEMAERLEKGLPSGRRIQVRFRGE